MGNRHPTLLVLRHMVSYVLILATLVHLVMPAKSLKLRREIQNCMWAASISFPGVGVEDRREEPLRGVWLALPASLAQVWPPWRKSHLGGETSSICASSLNWERRRGKKHAHSVSKIQTHSLFVMHLDIFMLQMVQGVCVFVCIRLCSICGSMHIGHKTFTNSNLHTVHLQRLVGFWTLLLCNMRRRTAIQPTRRL